MEESSDKVNPCPAEIGGPDSASFRQAVYTWERGSAPALCLFCNQDSIRPAG